LRSFLDFFIFCFPCVHHKSRLRINIQTT
jgi:hypothetical protein